jgi:hypothetical protein
VRVYNGVIMAKSKAKFAKISKTAVKARKKYPFENTKPGQSFEEDDLSQWARLRVSASRWNQKHGTNFIVSKEAKDKKTVLRCGEPVAE